MNIKKHTNTIRFDITNYLSISFLEKIGIDAPCQRQIDLMERIVKETMNKKVKRVLKA